jgi:ADP-ribosylation factor related protein 1
MMSNQDCDGVPVLMLANKQDIKGRAVSVEQIKEIFNRLAVRLDAIDSRVLPVSALTGEGIRDAMEWLQLRLLRNRSNRPPRLNN